MVNPGAFSSSRRAFLEAQKEVYSDAVASNHIADTVVDIQCRYFKRYPMSLPHNQEPTQEWLDHVDDDAPDPEIGCPDETKMNPDDYAATKLEYEKLVRDLKARKDQIKRQLAYQYNKDRDDHTSFEKGSSDHLAILAAKLTGESIKKPRLRTAYNVWGPKHRFFVNPVFKQCVINGNVPAKNQAALRSAIYKEMFSELPEDEQCKWAKCTENEHQQALEDIEKKLKAGASATPEDRQRVIQALPKIFEPILDLVAEHSGWKLTLMAGGPEPTDGGRLNMVSIHSGVTTGSIKMDFGRSERKAYRNYIIPTFGTFLKKCFTISLDDDVDVHRFELDSGHIQVVHPAKDTRKDKTTSSTFTASAQPLKFGPPIGKKKQSSAPAKPKCLNLTPAATSTLLALTTEVHQSSSSLNHDTASISTQHPLSPGPLPPVSRTSTPVVSRPPSRVPTPAPSQPPSCVPMLAPSRPPLHIPTPAPSRPPLRVPTPASSRSTLRAPSISRATTPGLPRPSSHAPTPAPTGPPSHIFSPSSLNQPSVSPLCGSLPSSCVQAASAGTSPMPPGPGLSTLASPAPMTISRHSTTPPTPLLDASPAPAPALQRSRAPLREILPQNKLEFSTPAGAATVPDPSTICVHDHLLRKSRKRKIMDENEGIALLGTKRTRSTAGKLLDHEGGPALKKQRRNKATNASGCAFDIIASDHCPPWIDEALDLLAAEDFGEPWCELVHAWLKFEASFKFKQDGQRLACKGHPRVVSNWIQRARDSEYRPNCSNIQALKASFKSWWHALQPSWRLVKGSLELQRGSGEWDGLRCSGKNGLLSAVASLFFWGEAAGKSGRIKGVWCVAVADFSYVLAELL